MRFGADAEERIDGLGQLVILVEIDVEVVESGDGIARINDTLKRPAAGLVSAPKGAVL